jgi:hypothetical protein
MQKNFAIVPVVILFAALQGGIIYLLDGGSPAIEILSPVFTVVCLILLTIRHPIHNNDSVGNKSTMIPAPFAVLKIVSTHENEIKTGLHQQ